MSRITGSDAQGMMEAYAAVYAPQELTEEQIWEEVENWVNSLLEEGYDLSEYTWEEMYESYLNEAPIDTSKFTFSRDGDRPTLKGAGGNPSLYATRLDAYRQGLQGGRGRNLPGSPGGRPTLAGAGGNVSLYGDRLDAYRRGLLARPAASTGQQPPTTQPPTTQPPAAPTVAAAGGKGGRVTVGTKYAATLGGQQGNVTYDASGKKTFTPNKPAEASKPAEAPSSTPTAERRAATGAELRAAQQARKAALEAGKSKPEAEKAAVTAGVERGTKLMGGPEGPGKIDTTSVQRDLARANAPKPATTSQATTAAGSSNVATSTGSTLNPSNVARQAAAPKPTPVAPKPTPSAGGPRTRAQVLGQSYEYDAYDLVLEYLLSEGHVETLDEALYVMMEMDSETIQSICEAKKPKKWIQKAIKHPGALSKELGVPEEENIPAGKLKKAAKAKGTLGKRARLAMTLKGLSKKKTEKE